MGDGTLIEWSEATWNPVVGCSVASPGCDHCYAAREAAGRLSGHPVYAGLAERPEEGGPARFTGEVRLLPERLDQPLRWRRPRLIFVNSMSDLFHPEVPYSFVVDVVAVMALAPRHTFQVLTKRPKRMARLLANGHFYRDVLDRTRDMVVRDDQLDVPDPIAWPLPNVWWGTSIESNAYAWRADALRDMPAAVRWVSAEPLLGPLDQLDLTDIDWVVVGGEPGPDARPMHPAWVRDLQERCQGPSPTEWDRAVADVDAEHGYSIEFSNSPEAHRAEWQERAGHGPAFLFKQWGEWMPYDQARRELGQDHPAIVRAAREVERAELVTVTSADPYTAMVKVGKREAGRRLDGRTWDEYPVARP